MLGLCLPFQCKRRDEGMKLFKCISKDSLKAFRSQAGTCACLLLDRRCSLESHSASLAPRGHTWHWLSRGGGHACLCLYMLYVLSDKDQGLKFCVTNERERREGRVREGREGLLSLSASSITGGAPLCKDEPIV